MRERIHHTPDMKQQGMTRRLCAVAMLCAMEIALSRLASINIGSYLKIGFGFIPIAVCAILTGPWWTLAMAAVADVVGALLFPTGAFFIGFTCVAAINGLLRGLILYDKTPTLWRSLLCEAVVAVCCNIVLNTVFLCVTGIIVPPGNAAFWPSIGVRALKNAIQAPVNAVILFALWKALERMPAQLRRI